MLLNHVEIDSTYRWDGTNGYGDILDEPGEVTVVQVMPGWAYNVTVQTEDGVRWHTRAKSLFPIEG